MTNTKGVLYINGLGDGRAKGFETNMLNRLADNGVIARHAHVDWYNPQHTDRLIDEVATQAIDILIDVGSVCLVGYSAGGSMAMNVFNQIKGGDVSVVNIAGRLSRGEVWRSSWRTLDHSAHIGTKRASHSFYGSVVRCEETVLPHLTDEDREHITVIKPLLDLVVPLHTMDVEGAKYKLLASVSHHHTGVVGTALIPDMV